MAYTVQKTDGSTLVIVSSNTVDNTTTSIAIHGRGKLSWGNAVNENFVHMLENFASSTAPTNPLEGQFWFNPVANEMRFWCGSPPTWQLVLALAGSGFVEKSGGPVGGAMTGDLYMNSSSGIIVDEGQLTFTNPSSTNALILNTGEGDETIGPSIELDGTLVAASEFMSLHIGKGEGTGSPLTNTTRIFRIGYGTDIPATAIRLFELNSNITFPAGGSGPQIETPAHLRVEADASGGNGIGRTYDGNSGDPLLTSYSSQNFMAAFLSDDASAGGLFLHSGQTGPSGQLALLHTNGFGERTFSLSADFGSLYLDAFENVARGLSNPGIRIRSLAGSPSVHQDQSIAFIDFLVDDNDPNIFPLDVVNAHSTFQIRSGSGTGGGSTNKQLWQFAGFGGDLGGIAYFDKLQNNAGTTNVYENAIRFLNEDVWIQRHLGVSDGVRIGDSPGAVKNTTGLEMRNGNITMYNNHDIVMNTSGSIINMNNGTINNLGTATLGHQAVRRDQVASLAGGLQVWTSGVVGYTGGAQNSLFSHSLGLGAGNTYFVQVFMKCTIVDDGYAVNDVISINHTLSETDSGSGPQTEGIAIQLFSNGVRVRTGNRGALSLTTVNGNFQPTAGRWNFIVKVIY